MTVTLQDLETRQTELAELIQKFKAELPTVLQIGAAEIHLQQGERYAGTVLDADGKIKHHLVLMAPRPDCSLSWDDAMAWAQKVGGSLPDRQEQALLFANCKPHLDAVWHWSCQQHETNASFAWYCYFSNGNQLILHKSAEGAAVAVRRVTP